MGQGIGLYIKNKGELGSSPLFNLNTQNYEKTTKTILVDLQDTCCPTCNYLTTYFQICFTIISKSLTLQRYGIIYELVAINKQKIITSLINLLIG